MEVCACVWNLVAVGDETGCILRRGLLQLIQQQIIMFWWLPAWRNTGLGSGGLWVRGSLVNIGYLRLAQVQMQDACDVVPWLHKRRSDRYHRTCKPGKARKPGESLTET